MLFYTLKALVTDLALENKDVLPSAVDPQALNSCDGIAGRICKNAALRIAFFSYRVCRVPKRFHRRVIVGTP